MITALSGKTIYHGDNGLYFCDYLADFHTYNGNNLWINYEVRMDWKGSGASGVNNPYAQPAPELLFASPMTNGRIIYYDKSYSGEAYDIFKAGYDTFKRLYNLHTAYSGGKTYWVDVTSTISTNTFYRYNAHYDGNKIDFYINGNYYSTMSVASKYFAFVINHSSRGEALELTNNYIKWITLTDKMSTDMPQPPYVLSEKDDNVYGYKN